MKLAYPWAFACAIASTGCATTWQGGAPSSFARPSAQMVPPGTTAPLARGTPRGAMAGRPVSPRTRGAQPYLQPRPVYPPAPHPALSATPPSAAFRPDLADEALRRPVGSPASPQGGAPAIANAPVHQPAAAPANRASPAVSSAGTPLAASSNAASPNASWQTPESPAESRMHLQTGVTRQSPAAQPAWKTVGQSSGGHNIETMQLGRGSRRLLISGSLYGNEADSVRLVEMLAELLQREPERLADFTVLLVRTPNPDGLADGTLTNSRGVSLNRNFPSDNFLTRRTAETGPAPASEPETRIVLELCRGFQPDRVVHVRSGQAERPLVLANSRAVPGLRERIDRELIDGGEFEAFKAGSLEEYVSETLGGELLLLWLPASTERWSSHLPRMASVLIAQPHVAQPVPPAVSKSEPTPPQEPEPRSAASDLFAPYTPPVSFTGQVESVGPPGKKGYVEILPPPPEFADKAHGLDPKYQELVPPGE